MTTIPVTFNGGNAADRNFDRDLWTWIKDQPQDVWLLLVRVINWDQVDQLLHRMVDHPKCDRAVAYYLFWKSDPGFHVTSPRSYRAGTLIHKIVNNCARGFYRSAELYCSPVDVVSDVNAYLKATAAGNPEALPFQVPDIFIGPLEGRKAKVPVTWTAGLWSEIDEVLSHYDCVLPRSEDDYWRQQLAGGNLAVGERLRTSGKLKAFAGTGSVSDRLQRVYGSPADYSTAAKSVPIAQPIYMQQRSVLNPNRKQRYLGYFFFALSLFIVLAYAVGYFLR